MLQAGGNEHKLSLRQRAGSRLSRSNTLSTLPTLVIFEPLSKETRLERNSSSELWEQIQYAFLSYTLVRQRAKTEHNKPKESGKRGKKARTDEKYPHRMSPSLAES